MLTGGPGSCAPPPQLPGQLRTLTEFARAVAHPSPNLPGQLRIPRNLPGQLRIQVRVRAGVGTGA
ncbi:hypothetical protein GCM10027055_26930 [Janibacter alkaliphilus]